MRTHYSEQLGRDYVDDDMLTRQEAALVLSTNAGRAIEPWYVGTLADKGTLPCQLVGQHKRLYQYSYLRNYIVTRRTGPKAAAVPTPGALRTRKSREKRRGTGPAGDDRERHRLLPVAV